MAVSIVYGADEMQCDEFDNMEYAKVVEIARKVMNVPEEVTDVRLNGREGISESKIVEPGDTVSFYKRSGSKGC